jgi:hypothetical protein
MRLNVRRGVNSRHQPTDGLRPRLCDNALALLRERPCSSYDDFRIRLKDGLSRHRSNQSLNPHYLHHPLHVICQNMKAHLRSHLR